jgi:hypothetical protein
VSAGRLGDFTSLPRSRRTSFLVALYGLPAMVGAAFSVGVVPPIIRAAYLGQSLAVLNRLFRRRIPHPVEHYLDLWQAAWQAILLAWLCHFAVVLAVRASDRWLTEDSASRTINRRLIAFALGFLALTVLSGPRHDYVAFVDIWKAVRQGYDPWWILRGLGYPLNAYGPLFNVLALPARVNAMAPKLLFALAYCLFAVVFLKGGMARPGPAGFPAHRLLAWLISPFPWVEVAYFGHFDVLVGIACVIAVAALIRGREVVAGSSLAVGFLLKLIPIVILPFVAIDLDREGRRIHVRFRLLAGAVVPMIVGYAASYAIWGLATFRPFTFAATRGSTLMSIYRYLRGSGSPLLWFTDHPNLDAWSTPCLAAALLAVFLVCRYRRADPATSALVAVLTTLLYYQVGFIQYQMILFLLMADWLSRHGSVLTHRPGLAVAILGYFGWLSVFDLIYGYAGGIMQPYGPWAWVGDRVGLPTFVLGNVLLVSLLRVAGRLGSDASTSRG